MKLKYRLGLTFLLQSALGLLSLQAHAGWLNQSDSAASPFTAGEDLQFAIRWGVVTGGYSSLKVQGLEMVEGQPAYHIVAEAHSTGVVNTFYPVRDRNDSWVEPQSPATFKYARNIHEGKYRIEEQVVLNQTDHHYHGHSYRLDKNTFEDRDGLIPPHVLDVLGSLYYVRMQPLEVGHSYTVDVHSGDKVYPLIVKVKKHQHIKVKAGKFDCLLVEPELRDPGIFISKGKKLEVWLTADARHMPVLMRSEVFIGHVSAELVKQTVGMASDSMQLTRNPSEPPVADPSQSD